MKNYIFLIKAAIGALILLQFIACHKQKDKECMAVKEPLEIWFKDSTLNGICISPFDVSKLWVNLGNNRNIAIWEVDISSGQKAILPQEKAQFYHFSSSDNGHQFTHKDQYDSLVWFAPLNKNIVYYDLRTQAIHELPVRSVSRVISRPNEVFFVSVQGFSYWDRKTKAVSQVPGIPAEFFQSSVMPDDTTIVLGGKYTYYFNSGQVKNGIFIYQHEHKGSSFSFKADNGAGFFYTADTLWYFHEGVIGVLDFPNIRAGAIKIIDQKYWQLDGSYFYSIDPRSGKINYYRFRLPNNKSRIVDYQIDSKYIWIFRRDHLMLISLLELVRESINRLRAANFI